MTSGILLDEGQRSRGCLFHKPGEQPGSTGPLVHVSVQGRLDEAMVVVEGT